MSSATETQQYWYGNGMKFCEYGDYACLPYEEIEADDEDIVKCPNCDGYCSKCEVEQELEDDTPCNPPCETRQMIGRSWWKNQGYTFPCGCAVNAHNKKYPQSKIEKIKW